MKNTITLKKLYCLTILNILILFFVTLYAQTPQKFTYQSVVRGSDGIVLKSSHIGLRLSILQTSSNGRVVYSEEHSTATNPNGVITIIIGDGTTTDNFSAIDWSTGKYFLRIQVDPLGGSNYLIEDTSQLLSVPYALHSGSSKTSLLLSGENYLSYSGNELTLKKVDLSANVSGTLPLTSGGTGATSAPMMSLITAIDPAAARSILGVGASGEDNSTPVSLTTVADNYLTLDGQSITAGAVPVSLGGTGATSAPMVGVITAVNAAAARTAIGTGTLAVQNVGAVDIDGGAIDGVSIGANSPNAGSFSTVSASVYSSAADADLSFKTGAAKTGTITIANGADGNIIISPEGTGRVVVDNLKFPAADGSTGQVLNTDGAGALSWVDQTDSSTEVSLATVTDNYLTITGQEVTAGTVPVSLGGTGGTDAAAARTALGVGTLAVQNVGAVDIDGGAIDATAIGATTASTGAFYNVGSF